MTAAVVTLALLAAGLGVTAAALGIRLAGIRGQLGDEQRRADGEKRRADDLDAAVGKLHAELEQERARGAAIDRTRRAELDDLQGIATRCADAGELRQWLNRLTSERSRG